MIGGMPVKLPDDPKQSTLYADWVRSEAPDMVEQAEELIDYARNWPEWYNDPDNFLADLERRASDLPAEHLPWFWDNVGHLLLPGWTAGMAYGGARRAERDHGPPADIDYCVQNALCFTRHNGLRGGAMERHLQRLREQFDAAEAHAEFARFLRQWAAHNSLPPAEDLHVLIRTAAAAAGRRTSAGCDASACRAMVV